ncbi:tRNA lysidine(34) synthetase TilS [Paenibacillus spiritus]|uniref:tRNA(Ile)-lysidine synthase n=1 Tax=Paenibacillus spiritus TaxID=2496557 RepID=A0A5J5G8A2_9BACL|nr:tRNA lysidine(34) synthetase TilS [Paenibacillus spiritus]KAA9003609.1 tRNA lysidine(34) synthetase TilS [Paenibacillus spiritus]
MEQWNRLVRAVEEAAGEHGLWKANDRIVVAVSGGPDSVALLHVLRHISLHSLPLSLICAHADHGFREESRAEAELVRKMADELGLPLETAELHVPAHLAESGLGPEGTARELRYAFLAEAAARHGATGIALGHHADDQAETVLLRLLRGSGPTGLAGMRWRRPYKKVELLRPLLRIQKAELVGVCREQGFPFAEDASNLQSLYVRNAVRLEILPFLEKYSPRLGQSLNQLAEIAAAEDDYMEASAEKLYLKIARREGERISFDRHAFAGEASALQRRLIKLILNYLSADTSAVDFPKIEAVRRGALQARPTVWNLDLGGGVTCKRQYDTIVFTSAPSGKQTSYTYEMEMPVSRLEIPEIGRSLAAAVLQREDWASRKVEGNRLTAGFDLEGLAFPLTVRSRLPGDTMRIMGLNGSKKVKDIYIDDKIPSSERHRIPIVCDALGQILWIPGVRRSAHAAVGRHTAAVLFLSLEEGNDAPDALRQE